MKNEIHNVGKLAKAFVAVAAIAFAGATFAGTPVFTIKNGVLTDVELNGATTVSLPTTVSSIAVQAFVACTELKGVTISSSVTNIHVSAFDRCSGLEWFTVESLSTHYKAVNGLLLTKDGKTLVHGVNGNVVIPDGVTSIGSGAFHSLSGLLSVTIPDSVTDIKTYAFQGCSGLRTIALPEGVTTIPSYVFRNCSNLHSVTLPGKLEVLGAYAFKGCTALTSVRFPATLRGIYAEAFYGCSGLSSVIFEDNYYHSFYGDAFAGCTNLSCVYINSSSLAGWSESVFVEPDANPLYYAGELYCEKLGGHLEQLSIPLGVQYIGNYAFAGCDATNAVIPYSVQNIKEGAFYCCDKLKSVSFPGLSNLKNVGDWAFGSCERLQGMTLPPGVTNIGAGAFYSSSVSWVGIPKSVTSIGEYAFYGCDGLKYFHVDFGDKARVIKMLEDSGLDLSDCSFLECDLSVAKARFDANGGMSTGGDSTWYYKVDIGTSIGESIGTLPTPTRDGYEFKGWFTAKTGGTKISESTVIVEEITFYAQWEKAFVYTVRYRKYDGSGDWATEDFECGKTYTLAWLGSELGWSRPGYEFCGWVPWNPDTKPRLCKYDNGQPVKDLAPAGETIDLYCGWKSSSSYRVCFHRCAGPDDLTKMNQVILRNKDANLAWMDSQIGWKRDGYTFQGWDESDKAATVKYANGAKVKNLAMNGGTKHLYAVWRAKDDHKYPYTVKYYRYDGSGETRTQSFKAGTAQNLLWLESQLGWKRDGYEFCGWVPWNPDAKARLCKYTNGQKVVDLASKLGETVSLYAAWKSASSYRVCLHRNDGTDVKMNQVILRNKEDTLAWMDSQIGWKREGYVFKGWAETAKGPVKYANGAKVKNLAMDGGTKHLYAVWRVAD